MFNIRAYKPQDAAAWNDFVRNSKNGTFLFDRNYMDYHSDRFSDYSLLILDALDNIVSILPAHRVGNRVVSHGGLTYGGLITDQRMTTPKMLDIFESLLSYLKQQGALELEYKCMPAIYHRMPAEEDLYALFRCKAQLKRRDVLSVIDRRQAPAIQERRVRGAKKAQKSGLSIVETDAWEAFWSILEQNLQDRFGKKPVHSVDEMRLLQGRFPNEIRLFVAQSSTEVVGGAVMFCTGSVAHVQYIASNPVGRQLHALDLLFTYLIDRFSAHSYFDFGVSTEENGWTLNQGLVEFKEGFGARALMHDHYLLELN